MRAISIFLFLLIPVLFACRKSDQVPQKAVAATLYDYTGLDGCSWVVDIEDGSGICEIASFPDTPVELKDGKKIWVTYKKADSQTSICMVGPRVDLTGIWERD